MTEIEEIVKLMLPELLLYFKSEKISDFVQKGLDNKGNTNCNISKTEFDNDVNAEKILNHFNQSKTLVNCQRNAFLFHKQKLGNLYHDGVITIKEAERKMLNWAEGKYYIDRHERAKYFDLGIDKKPKTDYFIMQHHCNER